MFRKCCFYERNEFFYNNDILFHSDNSLNPTAITVANYIFKRISNQLMFYGASRKVTADINI